MLTRLGAALVDAGLAPAAPRPSRDYNGRKLPSARSYAAAGAKVVLAGGPGDGEATATGIEPVQIHCIGPSAGRWAASPHSTPRHPSRRALRAGKPGAPPRGPLPHRAPSASAPARRRPRRQAAVRCPAPGTGPEDPRTVIRQRPAPRRETRRVPVETPSGRRCRPDGVTTGTGAGSASGRRSAGRSRTRVRWSGSRSRTPHGGLPSRSPPRRRRSRWTRWWRRSGPGPRAAGPATTSASGSTRSRWVTRAWSGSTSTTTRTTARCR